MDEAKEVRDIYNRIAGDYRQKRLDPQRSSWNTYLEIPAMAAILRSMVGGRKVLDLGCGTGILTNQIHEWGGDVCGVDISEEMIRLARQNYRSLDFQVCDMRRLPFENSNFDIIASSLVMHYLRDLRPGFAEASRILAEGGQFVFSMHHPVNESIDMKRFRRDGDVVLQPYFNDDRYYWRMCGAELPSFHHTFENIVGALKAAGFMLLDMVECRPDAAARGAFDDYEFTSRYPTFCVFHAGMKRRS